MTIALQYIWLLPVAIGVFGAYHFAMRDLGPNAQTAKPDANTED
jgi:hypothetical protein